MANGSSRNHPAPLLLLTVYWDAEPPWSGGSPIFDPVSLIHRIIRLTKPLQHHDSANPHPELPEPQRRDPGFAAGQLVDRAEQFGEDECVKGVIISKTILSE